MAKREVNCIDKRGSQLEAHERIQHIGFQANGGSLKTTQSRELKPDKTAFMYTLEEKKWRLWSPSTGDESTWP